jgi:hypothetical protein
MWQNVAKADESTRTAVRELIDATVTLAEDAGDLAAVIAARKDRESGAEPIPWEQVKAELEL